MNNTIVTSIGIITCGIAFLGYTYIYLSKTTSETRDRLTVCIQTVMSESRESGKPIDAEKAREVCG